jgi:hypothetical protein
MRVGSEAVGARGVSLLAVTAIVGVVIGVHGWSARHHGVPSTLAGPRHTRASGPTAAASPSAPPTQGPHASPVPTPGPKLSSQSYASYSFAVWPVTPTAAAKAAETGLVIKVSRQGNGILVSAGLAGQPLPAPVFYPTGAKVYVIEASMGDDASNSDYNLGDDGLVVTDAQGRILR